MSNKASTSLMEILHGVVAKELKDQIENGPTGLDADGNIVRTSAPAALLNVARAFLKDNRIESDPENPSEPMGSLADSLKDASALPFPAADGGESKH